MKISTKSVENWLRCQPTKTSCHFWQKVSNNWKRTTKRFTPVLKQWGAQNRHCRFIFSMHPIHLPKFISIGRKTTETPPFQHHTQQQKSFCWWQQSSILVLTKRHSASLKRRFASHPIRASTITVCPTHIASYSQFRRKLIEMHLFKNRTQQQRSFCWWQQSSILVLSKRYPTSSKQQLASYPLCASKSTVCPTCIVSYSRFRRKLIETPLFKNPTQQQRSASLIAAKSVLLQTALVSNLIYLIIFFLQYPF